MLSLSNRISYVDGLIEQFSGSLQQQGVIYSLLIVIGLIVGWLLARLVSIRKIATLEAMLQYEIQSAEERVAAMQQSFSALSGEALRHNNQQFLDLAQQTLSRFTEQADQNLRQREQAVEHMVKPLRHSLQRAEQQFDQFDLSRRDAHTRLTTQIENLSTQHVQLESETRKLVQALRRPEVRGQWGEISLRRLVELAGMSGHSDFSEQVAANDSPLRPDMVIFLPGNRQIVIDAKTPMDAYLNALNCESDQQVQHYLEAHALQVKQRIRELAAKSYWAQFTHSPDFVVLFIPGDQFLGAALERNPALLEQALELRIILATPTSLVALLRTIAHGWTQEKLNIHALEIRQSAEEYHQRLATFSEHLEALGKNIDRVIDSYNQGVGSYQRKLLPIARRFAELGLRKNKQAVEPAAIVNRPQNKP
jgi:DNA recombination protein RmuC